MTWQPTLGAWLEGDGTRFRVWAPTAKSIEVVIEGPQAGAHALELAPDGHYGGLVPGVGAGARYRYRINGESMFPDPASRYQPEGVHGPSQVVDTGRFAWTDEGWAGHELDRLVFYELHVGTFTPAGTFDGVTRHLVRLRDLGVTAVELMPVADFPGERGWGYDGVSLFAPARCYGSPEDLQRLVNTAHSLGMSVFLDVVYNHMGPDGNYTGAYSPFYLSKTHCNPWGNCLNFDGEGAQHVRDFFIENAIYWLKEFHIDGLRLDATHAIIDDSPVPFLAELPARVHKALPSPRRWLIAEDHRNLATMMRPAAEGGWGLDGVWADDFHHEMRRLLAGDCDGYYCDYAGTTENIATVLNKGWLYCGQRSEHLGEARGTDPAGLSPSQFVLCLQNHDQVGNRALGERLHHQIDLAAYRAATAVLLAAPQLPLLFMGQEWAASAPFRFFTDHNAELGRLVTEGRRNEFKHFKAFTDPEARAAIPDPQAALTFQSSQLDWDECGRAPHAGVLHLYQALLQLRQAEPALRGRASTRFRAEAWDDATLVMRSDGEGGAAWLVVARLKGAGRFVGREGSLTQPPGPGGWELALHTEEERFALQGRPPRVEGAGAGLAVELAGPAAVLFRSGGAVSG